MLGASNDLVTDRERAGALRAFAGLTRARGVLVLDVPGDRLVPERLTSMAYHACRTVGRLASAIGSRPTWNDGASLWRNHGSDGGRHGGSEGSEFLFEMRPWARDEVQRLLTSVGYGRIEMHPGVGRRTPDRLLVTARR